MISSKVDATGQTIGKRYARTDEIGIPFAITVDFDTLNDNTVTLRELLTLKQVRIPVIFYLFSLKKNSIFYYYSSVIIREKKIESKFPSLLNKYHF